MEAGGVVHVIDDEEGVLRTTARILRAGGYKPVTYSSGADFLAGLDKIEPGCVILDIRMPGLDGLRVQEIMNERQVQLPILILTGHADVDAAVETLKGGAVDFLQKPLRKQQLLDAVEAAQRKLSQQTERTNRRTEAQVRLQRLTQREAETLAELAKGLQHKVVAFNLGVSVRTVEVHRSQIMKKLEVRSLSEAVQIIFDAK